jgi:hypothetical protein
VAGTLIVDYWSPAQRLSKEPVGTTGWAPFIRLLLLVALATCETAGDGVGAGEADGRAVVDVIAGACGFAVSAFWMSFFCCSDFATSTLRGAGAGLATATALGCDPGVCSAESLFGLNSRVKKLS